MAGVFVGQWCRVLPFTPPPPLSGEGPTEVVAVRVTEAMNIKKKRQINCTSALVDCAPAEFYVFQSSVACYVRNVR